jgi:hypothetical protein
LRMIVMVSLHVIDGKSPTLARGLASYARSMTGS